MITLLYYDIIVLIACLFDCLIACLFNWLIVLLLFLGWLLDCLIVWLFDCLSAWLFYYLIVWLIDCFDCLGPGPLGAPGLKQEDTLGECNYLQWGRLPSVRQAISRIRHAPKRRILCTQTFPNTLHPTVSAYMHPTTAYMHPTVSANMHPKGADFAPKSLRIHAPESSRFSKFEKNVIWSRPYLDLFLRCLGVQGTP